MGTFGFKVLQPCRCRIEGSAEAIGWTAAGN